MKKNCILFLYCFVFLVGINTAQSLTEDESKMVKQKGLEAQKLGKNSELAIKEETTRILNEKKAIKEKEKADMIAIEKAKEQAMAGKLNILRKEYESKLANLKPITESMRPTEVEKQQSLKEQKDALKREYSILFPNKK